MTAGKKRAASAASPSVPKTALAARRFSWRKLSAAKWSDAWLERLAFLGPQRAMVIEFPGARSVRVEAHGVTRREADGLLKLFGGQVTESKWLTAANPPLRPPIRVRGRLIVVSTEKERRRHAAQSPRLAAVLIPAGMAFGTGEHATTAACLRILADVSRKFADRPWEALDLGTGSGILGIAARKLGARRVEAADFDPHAVRTAKENVRANGTAGVYVKRLDVRKWQPARTWEVVCSNLFSGLLVETAPKIAAAVAPGGRLVFSGILREQQAEVLDAFVAAGLVIKKTTRKGKWVSGLAARER
jgi:ribosomal protein L11 methyltransferase